MKKLVLPSLMALLMALLVSTGAGPARAADKNKCGCYKDGSGTCFCDKKAKCGCPGDCEPKGCEAAREKQIQKEIEAETKKAAEADRKHTVMAGGSKSSSGSTKASASGKKSSDDGAGEDPKSGKESTKAGSGAESAGARKLSPAQAKQLVKLLDIYFVENPDARTRNIEEVRNQLSQSR
jgi:hypothetical protein